MRNNNKINLYFLILLSFSLFISCNVEKNRKWLSVFFDGVPEKKSEINSTTKKWSVKKKVIVNAVQILSVHPDYKTKKCSKCHTHSVSSFLKTDKKKICFTCHKKEKFTARYVHGPIAVAACNTCHDPHRSKNRKLLVEDGRKLCDLCHRVPVTGQVMPCKGEDCLECHTPHVSDNKFFLKSRETQKVIPSDKKSTISRDIQSSGVSTEQKKDLDKKGSIILFKVRASDHIGFSRIVIEGNSFFQYKTLLKRNVVEIIILKQKTELLSVNNVSGKLGEIKFIKEKNILRFNVGYNYKILKNFEIKNPFRVIFDIKENKGAE